ncbi:MAG: hypothetical protein MJ010_03795 [Paludibacteraceae bacterium]|nr:hypothetical protein [Paludibacteraceae bacterium]
MAILLGVSSCKKDDKGSKFSATFSERSDECVITVKASESTLWQVGALDEDMIRKAEYDPYRNKKEICEWIARQAPRFYKGNNAIVFDKSSLTPNIKYYFYTFSVNDIDEAKVTGIAEIFEYTLTTNN